MAAAEAAQSIARSGLAVAKLSLDACNARSSQNGRGQSSDHLKGAFDLFARQKQPIMTYDKFQAALGLAEDDIDDDGVSREITLEFNSGNVGSDYHTCGSQEVPPQLNFYDANQGNQAASTLQLSQQLSRNTNIRQDADASRNVSNQKQNFVPKRFEKYLTPLGHTSGASSARTQKLANPCDGLQGKTCGTNPSSTNQIAERFYRLHAAAPPARAQTSASDELEPSAFWRPNDVTGTDTSSRRSKKDPYLADDGASSDDSTRSAPTSLEVRCRRTESSDEGSSPPLKPRQLQRLSDMEPTEENMMTRLQQQARRSQSCSSEPGADATRKRPCSPLVLPETDSGSNVQMLPNNVQAFQPAMAKSTTPPTSYHGNVTSSGRAYLSD
ncbi:uncharacterized protein [Diadema setosum]|uniref:uncharacterized protein n=1 Tax=Diadema setosum TaxID=31175 RepID=UPI003B3A4A86